MVTVRYSPALDGDPVRYSPALDGDSVRYSPALDGDSVFLKFFPSNIPTVSRSMLLLYDSAMCSSPFSSDVVYKYSNVKVNANAKRSLIILTEIHKFVTGPKIFYNFF